MNESAFLGTSPGFEESSEDGMEADEGSPLRKEVDDDEEEDVAEEQDVGENEGASELDDEIEIPQTPLEAWRQVQRNLVRAVAIAREAVAAKKAQRRFWMEEICANLTEDGSLTQTSVWKRPDPPKKGTSKNTTPSKAKETTGTKKRKKPTTPESTSGNVLKRIKKGMVGGRKKKDSPSSTPGNKKLRLKLPTKKHRTAAEEAAAHATADIDEASDDEDEDNEELLEVQAQDVADDDEEEEEEEGEGGEKDETDDEAEDERDAEDDNHYSPPHSHHQYPHHYPPHDYRPGHWGGHPHGYIHAGYSPPPYPSYHLPHHHPHHEQYGAFYSGPGGMQSGLSPEGFYSTYSGPPVDDGVMASYPTHLAGGNPGSGSESDGGPTF